jgi:hypothetical protein
VYVSANDPDYTALAIGGVLDDGRRIPGDPAGYCRTHSSQLCARWAARLQVLEVQSAEKASSPASWDDVTDITPPPEMFVASDEGFAAFQAWLEPEVDGLRARGANPNAEGYYSIKIGDAKGYVCAWCYRGARLCGPDPCKDRARWGEMRAVIQRTRAAIARGVADARKSAAEILEPLNPVGRG